MKRLLTITLVAMASVMMFAQHPQDLNLKGSVSSVAERISGGGYKFGVLTQDERPQRVDTFFLRNDAKMGAIWRGNKGGYFVDYKYDAEGKLISVDDRNELLFTEYIYDGGTLSEVNTYTGRDRKFVTKRKYYNKNGIKTSVLYNAQGAEISGSELYIYGKQKYSMKNYPGYTLFVYTGKRLTRKVDGATTYTYSYNKSGDLTSIKTTVDKTVSTRTFTYTYDSIGNWVKCTETRRAADGTESFLFYDRNINYAIAGFSYVDPVQRYDAAVAAEKARVAAEKARIQAARDKYVKDSIRARERFVMDSILLRERQVQDSLRQAEQLRAQAKQQEVEQQRKTQQTQELAELKRSECFRTNIINIDKNETGEIKKLTIDANGVFYFGNYTPTKYTEKEVVSNGKYVCYKGEGTDNYIVLEYEDGKIDDAYFILDAHTKDTKVNEHYEFDGAALKAIKKHFK